MYLLILESIGTSELMLIGVIALVFLGPRKLPQIAKTIGKYMSEFRKTTNEFKSTWEREVDFAMEEETAKTEAERISQEQIAHLGTPATADSPQLAEVNAPEIRQIDESAFTDLAARREEAATLAGSDTETAPPPAPEEPRKLGKQDWL